jgi:steroid delta-isomerase-like uncharacterized protein
MSVEENKAIARRWFEEAFNKHRVAAIDELYTPDFVTHNNPMVPEGNRAGAKQFFASLFVAMPDLSATVEDMVAEGDKVAVRYTTRGTQRGELMGIPATGKAVTLTAIDILRFKGGKIAEHWLEADQLGMMQQLGVIPTPGQAPG